MHEEYRPLGDPLAGDFPVSGKLSPRLPLFGRPVGFMRFDYPDMSVIVGDDGSAGRDGASEIATLKKSVENPQAVREFVLGDSKGNQFLFALVAGRPDLIDKIVKFLEKNGFEKDRLTNPDIFSIFINTNSTVNAKKNFLVGDVASANAQNRPQEVSLSGSEQVLPADIMKALQAQLVATRSATGNSPTPKIESQTSLNSHPTDPFAAVTWRKDSGPDSADDEVDYA